MKYKIIQIIEIVIIEPNQHFSDRAAKAQEALDEYLREGYEIYKAIPLVTNKIAVIKYILRKEDTNE